MNLILPMTITAARRLVVAVKMMKIICPTLNFKRGGTAMAVQPVALKAKAIIGRARASGMTCSLASIPIKLKNADINKKPNPLLSGDFIAWRREKKLSQMKNMAQISGRKSCEGAISAGEIVNSTESTSEIF